MKRPMIIALLSIAGLTAGGLFALWRAVRTAPLLPADHDMPAPKAVQPIDRLQGSMKLDLRTDYTLDAAAKAKLRDEEMRQRPWERRN